MAERTDCLGVDCGRAEAAPDPEARSCAGLDLMAKDYDSLLRAMLDQLPRLAPGWADRSEADAGMVLMELFAYAGDQLSYLQDRVALEGYLRTATQTESVRKLLRLIDYTMDPGCAAQTHLALECVGAAPLFLARGFSVRTPDADAQAAVVYETAEDAVLHPALSRIALAADAPSSADAREAVLQADLGGVLAPGAWLLFEQGRVREWAQVESFGISPGLTTVTLTAPLSAHYRAAEASVHGNRVLATHGASQRVVQRGTGAPGQRVALELAPLTWVQDEATQRPVSTLSVTVDGIAWVEVEDFIDSDAAARHHRVLRDNAGYLTLLFGDGASGAVPAAGTRIEARYRVGLGLAGLAAADALSRFDPVAFPDATQHITRMRNPLPATHAREPQSLAQAKLAGPTRLREQARAVVPSDFERTLADGVRVNGQPVAPLQSHARVRHTGSWDTVVVSVDLPSRRPLAETPGLREAFEHLLRTRKMAGVDVRVEDARYAALHIGLLVEVQSAHFARDVRQAVERALIGAPAAGRPANAFFAPGRFGFGQAVYLSDLYAAVTAVPGVASVAVTRFKRLGDRHPDDEARGRIEIGALEVARCDHDPHAPEWGVIAVRTRGGKEG